MSQNGAALFRALSLAPVPDALSPLVTPDESCRVMCAEVVVAAFAAQDLGHSCLVSHIPTSTSLKDGTRLGGAAWRASDGVVLRMALALCVAVDTSGSGAVAGLHDVVNALLLPCVTSPAVSAGGGLVPVGATPDSDVTWHADVRLPSSVGHSLSALVFSLQRCLTRAHWRPVLEFSLDNADGSERGSGGAASSLPSLPVVSLARESSGRGSGSGVGSGAGGGGGAAAAAAADDVAMPSAALLRTPSLGPSAARGSGDVSVANLGPYVPKGYAPFGVVAYEEGEDAPVAFDPVRCAECISIGGGHTTVRQVVDKTWGVVLCSNGFSPGTGVHAWDVKLKKCDRGYVCVGVATREASTAVHLGGDRHGCVLPCRSVLSRALLRAVPVRRVPVRAALLYSPR